MRYVHLLVFILVVVMLSEEVSAGWFRRTSRKIGKVARRIGDNIKKAGSFVRGAALGSRDMHRAYSDMRKANWKNSDKYFHARGNYDAAKHGPGGKWAAKVISNAREAYQSSLSGQGPEDTAADQRANKWGREGGDPNKYRPKGLPKKYR